MVSGNRRGLLPADHGRVLQPKSKTSQVYFGQVKFVSKGVEMWHGRVQREFGEVTREGSVHICMCADVVDIFIVCLGVCVYVSGCLSPHCSRRS